ncbi:MAG: hypothetical protein M1308_16655, partial [Actinobacteria bacterium]|nr:hypothetical protein [Actinomycetota bacterium]
MLESGIHEVALPVNKNKTLVSIEDAVNQKGEVVKGEQDKSITIKTSKENSWVEYAIPDYDPDKTYVVSFYYRVIKGAPPQMQIWQDSDKFKNKSQAKISLLFCFYPDQTTENLG